MKKAIFILAAALMVFSGVAAVSAYEAHMINIKAHVENALIVPTGLDLGTLFPEEFVESVFAFNLSNSFKASDRLSDVDYVFFWYPKPIPAGVEACDPDNDGIYEDLYPYVTLGHPGTGDGVGNKPGYNGPRWEKVVAWGNLNSNNNKCDVWHLIINVPVFREWYNPTTDPKLPGILEPEQYCVVDETCEDCPTPFTGKVPHADLGNDLKIQVIAYSYHVAP